jgi:hypothetical protein
MVSPIQDRSVAKPSRLPKDDQCLTRQLNHRGSEVEGLHQRIQRLRKGLYNLLQNVYKVSSTYTGLFAFTSMALHI